MNFLKKINIKLIIIIFSFMLIISGLSMGILYKSFKRSMDFTFESKHYEITNNMNSKMEVLKGVAKKISQDENIINILETNRSFNDFDISDKNLARAQIGTFEGILKNLTFVEKVNIINVSGNYGFRNGVLSEGFNSGERPWLSDEIVNSKDGVLISDIYIDYNTGKQTISIISLIYSKNGDEILGASILDIFVDKFIKSMDNQFYLGNLKTYIEQSDGNYYGENGDIYDKKKKSGNYYVKETKNILKEGINVLFEFDKDSIVYNKKIKAYNNIQIFIFISAGLILTMILTFLIKVTFNPIVASIDKFKSLLNTSDNNIDFENGDEIEQLELISNVLSKSFDDKIKSLIYYDELTKLPNRKMLIKRVKELIDIKKEFALIFIDLNKFKDINDSLGHLTGDEVLKSFSYKIKDTLKDEDIVIRYSGDEFIILYTDYKGEEELNEFYENKILNAFDEDILINNKYIRIEFSAGVAVYPENGEDLNSLINKSDIMMYENKKKLIKDKLLFSGVKLKESTIIGL